MMNFWLLLAVVVACAIVWAAHRYLSRSATIWLGVLLVAVSGMALMLDFLNDGIRTSILSGHKSTTGQSLFAMGPEISILGAGWNFALLALLCGFTLIIKGAFMKSVKRQNEDVDLRIDDVDDAVRIENELNEELTQVTEAWDPKELGTQDAIQPTGAVPGGHETKPTGNEKNIRNRYMHLARDFLRKTVRGLQKNVADAFGKLVHIINSTATTPYEQIASIRYNETRPQHTDYQINSMRDKIKGAKTAIANFAERQNASPDELEWSRGSVSMQDLLLWGLGFALAEFLANYGLLRDEIGANQAITAALFAVFIILLLSFVCAWVLQFTRGKQTVLTRLFSGSLFVFGLVTFSCAFGLLLGWRDATATDIAASEGALATLQTSMNVIGNGYVSILGSTPNITVFLVNVIAFCWFGWKVIHWTDKYQGYSTYKGKLDEARKDWDDFLQAHANSVRESLDVAGQEVISNVKNAGDAALIIRAKMGTLENIRQIIGGLYTAKLHPAYSGDMQEYRTANSANRELGVDPVPEFWDSYPELCDVEDHFTADLGIEKFFDENGEALRNIDAHLHSIRAAADEWRNNSAALGNEWSEEFEARIQRILMSGKKKNA